ncbi:MAG: hypothetical protein GPOALKHO_000630 [Sodalis sp.]|nr:MAG: hypothetical protein GPOALKHO_000630 [Sodalis sp.]
MDKDLKRRLVCPINPIHLYWTASVGVRQIMRRIFIVKPLIAFNIKGVSAMSRERGRP